MQNGDPKPFSEAKGGTILAYPVNGAPAVITKLGRTWKIVDSGKNVIRKDSYPPEVYWDLPDLPKFVDAE